MPDASDHPADHNTLISDYALAQQRALTSQKMLAILQAERITDYWHRRGHLGVRAWIRYIPNDGYKIESNLVRGLPPQ